MPGCFTYNTNFLKLYLVVFSAREARSPKARCPRTHNQKIEMPYWRNEISLDETFYDYKYVHRKSGIGVTSRV